MRTTRLAGGSPVGATVTACFDPLVASFESAEIAFFDQEDRFSDWLSFLWNASKGSRLVPCKQKGTHTHARSLRRHRYPYLPEMQKLHALDQAHAASVAGLRFRTADFHMQDLQL
jgi:hypothetical protein